MCIRCIQNDVIIIFVVIDIRPSVIVPSFGMLWDVWDALGCFFGRSTIPKSVSIRNGILEMGLFFFFFCHWKDSAAALLRDWWASRSSFTILRRLKPKSIYQTLTDYYQFRRGRMVVRNDGEKVAPPPTNCALEQLISFQTFQPLMLSHIWWKSQLESAGY